MICESCEGAGYVDDPVGIARACSDCGTWGHRCQDCGNGCEDGLCDCQPPDGDGEGDARRGHDHVEGSGAGPASPSHRP